MCVLYLGVQNFSDQVQREQFQIKGWMEGVGKCAFQWKTGYISETVRDTAKVTINH